MITVHCVQNPDMMLLFSCSHDNSSSCSGGHGDERSPQILAKAVQVHSEMLKGMYFA